MKIIFVLLFFFLLSFSDISYSEESVDQLKKEYEVLETKKKIRDLKKSMNSDDYDTVEDKMQNKKRMYNAEKEVIDTKHKLKVDQVMYNEYLNKFDRNFGVFAYGSSTFVANSYKERKFDTTWSTETVSDVEMKKSSIIGGGLGLSYNLVKTDSFALPVEASYTFFNQKVKNELSGLNVETKGLGSLSLNPTFRLLGSHFSTSSFDIYGKFGVGVTKVSISKEKDESNYGGMLEQYKSDGRKPSSIKIGLLYGGGVIFNVNERVGLRFEYEQLNVSTNYKFSDPVFDAGQIWTGEVVSTENIKTKIQVFKAGLMVRF